MPHLVREITEAEPGGVPARCLPELLKEQGYNSVWFSSATEHFGDRGDLVETSATTTSNLSSPWRRGLPEVQLLRL